MSGESDDKGALEISVSKTITESTNNHQITYSWRNDDAQLDEYFRACALNWKEYAGERTAKQVLRLQSVYKQAIIGDNPNPEPENLKSLEGVKWSAWMKCRGMPKTMAKRRFITLLAEINPVLIDILPAEKPPEGFPLDGHGNQICAKCNTVSGCFRPITDSHKVDLRTQLFDCEALHEPENLRLWYTHVIAEQRCCWGVHKPIFAHQAKPFTSWFERDENKGFQAYNTADTVNGLVKELMFAYYESAHEMMLKKETYDAETYNARATQVFALKRVVSAMIGTEYVYEIPCERDIPVCNRRREADKGVNHTHPFEIDLPTKIDTASYSEALELRKQCQTLGLELCTGVVQSIQKRCDIYKERIAAHFEAMQRAAEAKARNEARLENHLAIKKKVKEQSLRHIVKQCQTACDANDTKKVLTLVRRGCPPDTESVRGITPLLCGIINNIEGEELEQLLLQKANPNAVTYFGRTALMIACRLRDMRSIHILMKNGAAALQNGGRRGRGCTALHYCAIHGCEEEARTIVDYVKEGGGDLLRVTRFLDWQNMDGDTALMVAAKRRNGLMCRILSTLGANPNIRNNQGRNACYLARAAGWSELSDWLEKKVGSGVAKLETYSDLQYDKQLRYGVVKLRERLEEFGKEYIKTVFGQLTRCPLVCPSMTAQYEADNPESGRSEHILFADRHQQHIMNRTSEYSDYSATDNEKQMVIERQNTMRQLLKSMLDEIIKGTTNPNGEYIGNPLPWTPLMCAVAINEVKFIRLLIREGANPNHPNRFGITPVMLAAQLHNVTALVELIILGGDIDAVDNEGFNCMAYATSLPLPRNNQHTAVGVILGADAAGVKRLNGVDILNLARKCGLDGNHLNHNNAIVEERLRRELALNEEETSDAAVDKHFKFLRLLENFGLSRMETIVQIANHAESSQWRLSGSCIIYDRNNANESETSSQGREREIVEQYEKDMEREMKLRQEDPDYEVLRCPVCTLVVPCVHFFKVKSLKEFLRKKAAGFNMKLATATGRHIKLSKVKMKEHKRNVLEIAGLDDRFTDRSLTRVKQYRARAYQLEEEAQALKEAVAQQKQFEIQKQYRIAQGTWTEWEKHYDIHGVLHYTHVETKENWFECFDSNTNKAYYYNPESGESSWISPEDMKIVPVCTDLIQKRKQYSPAKTTAATSNSGSGVKSNPTNGTSSTPETALENGAEVELQSILKTTDTQNSKSKSKKRRNKGRVLLFELVDEQGEKMVVTTTGDAEDGHAALNKNQQLALRPVTPEKDKISAALVEDEAPTTSVKTFMEVGMSDGKLKELRNLKESVFPEMGPNPVPVESRSMFMFTREFMDRNGAMDGLYRGNPREKVNDHDIKKENTRLNSGVTPEDEVPPDGNAGSIQNKEVVPSSSLSITNAVSATARAFGEGFDTKSSANQSPVLRRGASFSALHYAKRAAEKQALKREMDPTDLESLSETQKVQISGWIFVSLSALKTGQSPVKMVQISLENWGNILVGMKECFLKEWLPLMIMGPLPNINTWKVSQPRCTICGIGYCRWKNMDDIADVDKLCLSCLVRRDLYQRIKKISPHSFKKRIVAEWPFADATKSNVVSEVNSHSNSRLSSPQQKVREKRPGSGSSGSADLDSGIGGNLNMNTLNKTVPGISTNALSVITNFPDNQRIENSVPGGDPFSPGATGSMDGFVNGSATRSQELLDLDELESLHDSMYTSNGKPVTDPWLALTLTEEDKEAQRVAEEERIKKEKKLARLKRLSSPIATGFGSSIKKPKNLKRPGTGGDSDEERDETDGADSRSAARTAKFHESLVSPTDKNNVEKPVYNQEKALMEKQGPAELSLLPFLVTKGHYEEVERISRLCLGNTLIPQFNEGHGMNYLAKLFYILAEMYKAMGLWILALALYMDATDMLISLLGYEDGFVFEPLGFVTNCLRKMHQPQLARAYLNSIIDQIESSSRAQSKAVLGKKLLDHDRYTICAYDVFNMYVYIHLYFFERFSNLCNHSLVACILFCSLDFKFSLSYDMLLIMCFV